MHIISLLLPLRVKMRRFIVADRRRKRKEPLSSTRFSLMGVEEEWVDAGRGSRTSLVTLTRETFNTVCIITIVKCYLLGGPNACSTNLMFVLIVHLSRFCSTTTTNGELCLLIYFATSEAIPRNIQHSVFWDLRIFSIF